jgi:serine/threonine protein kinase
MPLQVRFSSFGLSTVHADKAEIIIRGGEPAEEQYYLAGPADVWCLGIILAMLLTGFAPPQISQAARNQTLGQIPCDPAATDIVKACLRLDPNERATIEEIAVHPWVTGVLDK